MEVRNGKKMNFKRIYSQIAKYGKIIPELAEEYAMEEELFIARIQMGLEPKLFSNAIKANERNLKHRQSIKKVKVNQEDKNMAKRNEAIVQGNYRQKQSERDKANSIKEKRLTLEMLKKQGQDEVSEVSNLENKLTLISNEISEKEKSLDEILHVFSMQQENVTEKQKAFEEASKVLTEAKNDLEKSIVEFNKTKAAIEKQVKSVETSKTEKQRIENQITELKNKKIYLVDPSYTGEKPEYGTFYSTTSVENFGALSIVEPNKEFAIEPDLKDMLVAGFDSFKEYSNALRFVMLCAEYACKDAKYSVLVEDERLERLIKTHVG